MRKILALCFVFMLAFASVSLAASTYKYQIAIEDQFGNPIESGATLYVKTVSTNTNASVWPTDDTETGTLTGSVTPDSNGKAEWYSTASSHDVIVLYHGRAYAYIGFTPSSDRRIQVQKFDSEIDLNDTEAVASASDLVLPLRGSFFRVTGTTNVNRISETGQPVGKRVSLLFSGASLGIGQALNIDIPGLVGTLTVGSGTLVELIFDGTNWIAVGSPYRMAT